MNDETMREAFEKYLTEIREFRQDRWETGYAFIVVDSHWDTWKAALDWMNTRAQASEPCVGCGGNPAPHNNPCAVCGQASAPEGVAVEWQFRLAQDKYGEWQNCKPFVFEEMRKRPEDYEVRALFTRSNAKAGELEFPDEMPLPDDVHSPRYIMDHNFALGFNACRAMWVAAHDKTKA